MGNNKSVTIINSSLFKIQVESHFEECSRMIQFIDSQASNNKGNVYETKFVNIKTKSPAFLVKLVFIDNYSAKQPEPMYLTITNGSTITITDQTVKFVVRGEEITRNIIIE
jgi:hypothetical protein